MGIEPGAYVIKTKSIGSDGLDLYIAVKDRSDPVLARPSPPGPSPFRPMEFIFDIVPKHGPEGLVFLRSIKFDAFVTVEDYAGLAILRLGSTGAAFKIDDTNANAKEISYEGKTLVALRPDAPLELINSHGPGNPDFTWVFERHGKGFHF